MVGRLSRFFIPAPGARRYLVGWNKIVASGHLIGAADATRAADNEERGWRNCDDRFSGLPAEKAYWHGSVPVSAEFIGILSVGASLVGIGVGLGVMQVRLVGVVRADLKILRADVNTLRTETRKELDDLGSAIEALRTELKDDIDALRTELKDDIDALRTELKGELDAVRTDLRSDFQVHRSDTRDDSSNLRAEIAALRTECREDFGALRVEISGIRTDMRTDMAALRAEIRDVAGGRRASSVA